MKKTESKDGDVAKMAELLCSGSNANQVHDLVEALSEEEVQDLCTTILEGGHTLLHLLAQRQKVQALQALLQHRGGSTADVINTRNAQGATPLTVALQHNSLFSAKVLLDHGANPSEVVSRQKGRTLLHVMVTCDRPHAVLLLLQEGADANARDLQGLTPFHLATILGNPVIVAIFMRFDQCDLNAVDEKGHTGVMLAIINNNVELARQLVEAPGVDIVRRDNDGMSCLHLAVSLGQLEVARGLLRRNTANINSKERRMGRTPIHFACALGCDSEGTVTTSCFPAASPEAVNGHCDVQPDSKTPDAASVSKRGRDSPAKIDFSEFVGESDDVKVNVPPISVSLGHPGYSKFKRSPSRPNNVPKLNGHIGTSTPRTPRTARVTTSVRTPLTSTPRSVRTPLTSTPRSVRTPLTSTPRSVRTPLTSTPRTYTPRLTVSRDSSFGEVQAANSPRRKMTASSGSDSASAHNPSRCSVSGDQHTPRPKSYLVLSPVKAKQSTCSEASSRSQRPSTAPAFNNLHARFNSAFPTSLVSFRIPSALTGRESAASYRSRDSLVTPVTPFNVSLIRSKMVALLLGYDADANLMTTFRKSPLHIISIMGAADVMALLLPHITNINVLSASNKTALHLAVEGGYVSLVSQLINAGASLTMRDIAGMTALHLAAMLGHAEIVSLLLKAKAPKDCCDFQQRMPLHHACLHDHDQVVHLLVRAGACLDRPDEDGVLPLDCKDRASKVSTEKTSTSGPQQAVTEAPAEVGRAQIPAAESMMPQRRRKLGMVQPTNNQSVPLPTQSVPSPVVLCSVVAL